jgi:uncharacterized membrane protein YheB (UPF0754 family)
MFDFLLTVEFWKYASIPFVAALVGWVTNWMAIKLTFYPVHFIGIPPYLGWRGVIPSKAEKMARISVDKSLSKIGTLQEIFDQMDPDIISKHIARSIEPWVSWYTNDVLFLEYPKFYKQMPEALKERVFDELKARLPEIVDEMMLDIRDNIYEVLDLTEMVVAELKARPRLLIRIFLECGVAEFRFLIKSGIYFGFLFGLFQTVIWYYYPQPWVLPAFGVFVGLATNWLALTLIFNPLNPIRIGPWQIQGLFLKRQREASRIWCRIVTEEIVTLRNLIDAMLNGPKSDNTRQIIARHVREMVDDVTLEMSGPLRDVVIGEQRLQRMKAQVSNQVIDLTSNAFNDEVFSQERQKIVEEMMFERMSELSPEEFQDMLRPAFKEDEWKLILAGGVLGALAGAVQFVLVFAN